MEPMTEIHYRTEAGVYLGCFVNGAEPPEGAIECPAPPDARATWTGESWEWDAAAASRSDMRLTFAQLLIGLVQEGWIAEQEGEAWLNGTLPAAVLALIQTLPAEARFPARARASRPSEVLRLDPLVVALGQMQGRSPEELDQFFMTYRAA